MLPSIHKRLSASTLAAAFIYREQLEAIRKNHYQVFTRKIKISHFRKLQLLREVTSYLEKSIGLLLLSEKTIKDSLRTIRGKGRTKSYLFGSRLILKRNCLYAVYSKKRSNKSRLGLRN